VEIKPFYTIKELSIIINKSTTYIYRNFVQRNILPYTYFSNILIIYLSDIQRYMPDLYDSMIISLNINNFSKKQINKLKQELKKEILEELKNIQ